MQLGAVFLRLDIYCLDWTFFLWPKQREKKKKFTTGEDHLLGQDAAECMSVLLH